MNNRTKKLAKELVVEIKKGKDFFESKHPCTGFDECCVTCHVLRKTTLLEEEIIREEGEVPEEFKSIRGHSS